jgi:DMSO/TMAO reductase YedYZ heme-binding membrane subunit
MTSWYVVRASGLVAYALLTAAVVGGLLLSTRVLGRGPPAAWLLDWHRFVGGLAATGTVLHLVAVWIDDYIDFAALDLLVPFVSPWRPTALAFGIVGLYLLLVIELTSLARRHMAPQLWRRVHYLSLPALAASTVHLLMAGEDADEPAVLLAVGGGVGITFVLASLWLLQLASGR